MIRKIKSFLFENHNVRQIVAKNAFWLSFSNLIGRLLRAILIIAIARILGAEEYGVFSYALSLAAFFTILSDIGITPILTREAAKNPEAKTDYISTSFFIKIILLFITVVATVIIAPLFTKIEAAKNLLPIMAFLLTFDGLQNFIFAITRAENRMEFEGWLTILTNIYIVGLSFAVLFTNPTSLTLAIAYTAGSGLSLITVYFVLKRKFKGILSHFKKSLVKKILVAGWPFTLAGVLGSIMLNTDTIMLGWLRNASEVGLYAAAQRPIQLIILVPGIIATSIFPTIARLVEKGEYQKLKEITEKVVTATMLFSIPLFLGGAVIAQSFVKLLFGNEYLSSASSFAILLGTVLFSFPGIILNNLLFAHDKQKTFIISTGIGAVGNFMLNLILIPSFGIFGASTATLLTQIIVNIYISKQAEKIQQFHLFRHLKKIIISAILMAFATLAMELMGVPILVNIGLSMAFYAYLLYVFKEPLLKEFNLILKSNA